MKMPINVCTRKGYSYQEFSTEAKLDCDVISSSANIYQTALFSSVQVKNNMFFDCSFMTDLCIDFIINYYYCKLTGHCISWGIG